VRVVLEFLEESFMMIRTLLFPLLWDREVSDSEFLKGGGGQLEHVGGAV